MMKLAAALAFLGITLTGFAPEQYRDVQAIALQGTLAFDGAVKLGARGTVCDRSVPGWWTDFCVAYGADPDRPTILFDMTDANVPALLAHETRHAIFGADGPAGDPNNEAAANAAGCAQQWDARCAR
jgi:hypothetical protein